MIIAPSIIVPRRSRVVAPRATTDLSAPEPGGGFGLVGFQTWTEVGGILYGAKPDLRGPIGGHEGYTEIVTTGDYVASTKSAIQSALDGASPGEVVFVPGTASVDLSTSPLIVPAGVTLASDRGHNGSNGALLYSDVYGSHHIVEPQGDDIRITGLRMKGHDDFAQPGLNNNDVGTTVAVRCANGSRLEIDNCEFYNWIQAGVYFRDEDSDGHYAHHNYCHHIWSHDQGYGFVMNQCGGLFEYNLFDRTRHCCAHTGRNPVSNPEHDGSGDYTAQHNVCSLNPDRGTEWDMHSSPEDPGTLGSNNGGRCGILRLINNYQHTDLSITGSHGAFVQIRGTPYADGSEYTHNWVESDSTIWDIDNIFVQIEQVYNEGRVVWNRNLWDGPAKTVRGPGT